MKTKSTEQRLNDVKFPLLVIYRSTGNVFLMINHKHGTLVHRGEDSGILLGYQGNSMADDFEVYHGTVELKS